MKNDNDISWIFQCVFGAKIYRVNDGRSIMGWEMVGGAKGVRVIVMRMRVIWHWRCMMDCGFVCVHGFDSWMQEVDLVWFAVFMHQMEWQMAKLTPWNMWLRWKCIFEMMWRDCFLPENRKRVSKGIRLAKFWFKAVKSSTSWRKFVRDGDCLLVELLLDEVDGF